MVVRTGRRIKTNSSEPRTIKRMMDRSAFFREANRGSFMI
jgi:hypothetical protein